MDKETIEKKLKYEFEFLKIYSFFIIATGAGTFSLILRGNFLKYEESVLNLIELFIIMLGNAVFITFVVVSFNSLIRIKRLFKNL